MNKAFWNFSFYMMLILLVSGCSKKGVPAKTESKVSQQEEATPAPADTSSVLPVPQPADSIAGPDPNINMDPGSITVDKPALRSIVDDLNKQIKTNPDDGKAYAERGRSKIDMGDVRGGCADLNKAKEMGVAGLDYLLEKHCK